MKFAHNTLLVYQWIVLAGGVAAGVYFAWNGAAIESMLGLVVSFLSLIALKLEVWSLR
ncbi:MAG: hypothetical protein LC650_04915 [Actinobacteria bacterium]|nr:hypothetical protein [Actinomycetota bacterium]